MENFIKRSEAGLIVLALVSGVMGVCAAAAPVHKDCCGTSAPAAPKVPCAQMSCCAARLPNAVVTNAPFIQTVLFSLAPFVVPIAKGERCLIAASANGDPPSRPPETHSARS